MSWMQADLMRFSRKKVEEKREEIGRNLMGGRCSSFENYRHEVGRAAGLREAVEIMEDAARRYTEELDDE